MANQLKNIIKNSLDLHYHVGPEIIPRKYNSVDKLINQMSGKIKGLALKNHFYPTQPFINQARLNNLELIGSITLNQFAGGLNPNAIYSASLLSKLPIIVWLPTINSQAFLNSSKYEVPPEWVENKQIPYRLSSSIQPVLIDKKITKALQQIKESNAILATAHISWSESIKVFNLAKKIGLEKIIITHPIYQRINFPNQELIKLAEKGAMIEQCWSMYSIDKIPIKRIYQQIKAVGIKNSLLTSDVGQKFSPDPDVALYRFSQLLIKAGLSLNDIKTMLVKNPHKLIYNK